MKLHKGDLAPAFALKDIDGKSIKLEDYQNKKLLVCFFRYGGCPFCNVLLLSLVQRYPKFHERGLEVIAFVQSPKESITKYMTHEARPKVPFPLIADPDRKIYDLYGVTLSKIGLAKTVTKLPTVLASMLRHHIPQGKIDGNLLLMPAFFLIGPKDLRIQNAHYSADFADMIPDVEILNFLLFE